VDEVTTAAALREWVAAARLRDGVVGAVPTMGALHEGHLSLVRRARAECGAVVVTLFVNPAQFGPGEDLARYPRDYTGDRAAAAAAGADLVFAPPAEVVYPPGFCTWVTVEGPALGLEGAARPGHFRGVATVVARLLHLVQPDRAYFGEKDYQQLHVVRRLVRDLGFPVEVVPCPTVREADGLALSSRNGYLSAEEREAARALPRALFAARDRFDAGERRGQSLLAAARERLEAEPRLRIDYLALADAETLAPIDAVRGRAVLLAAAYAGSTRLIDNVILPG